MTISRALPGRRAVVVAVVCGALAAGCAQPGQLGSAPPTPAAAPSAASQPPPSTSAASATPVEDPAQPAVLAGGRVDGQVTIDTRGPAQFIVLRQVIPPDSSTAWLRNPGTEISSVQEGGIVLQLAGSDGTCVEAPYGTGQAYFIGDAVPYRVRNDGDLPAELVVSRLFAPASPDPEPVPAPC